LAAGWARDDSALQANIDAAANNAAAFALRWGCRVEYDTIVQETKQAPASERLCVAVVQAFRAARTP
jgi:hypothetical protein